MIVLRYCFIIVFVSGRRDLTMWVQYAETQSEPDSKDSICLKNTVHIYPILISLEVSPTVLRIDKS
jgi:hypothetical protein